MDSSYIAQLAKRAAYTLPPSLYRQSDKEEEREEPGTAERVLQFGKRNLLAAPIGFSGGMLGAMGLGTAAMPLATHRGKTFSPEGLHSFLQTADIKHPFLYNAFSGGGSYISSWSSQPQKQKVRVTKALNDLLASYPRDGGERGEYAERISRIKRFLAEKGKKSFYQLDQPPGRATAAHEAGHLKQRDVGGINTLTDYLYQPLHMKRVALPASALVAALPSRRLARIAAIAGTAAMTPTLLHEIVGSHYGGKMLAKHLGGSWMDKAKHYGSTYKGVPTYAAAAAAPLLTYWIASALGRWKDEKKKEKRNERERL